MAANEPDYVKLGLSYADVCKVLSRRANGKKLDSLTRSVCDAHFECFYPYAPDRRRVEEMQKEVVERCEWSVFSRLFYARSDEKIVARKSDPNRLLVALNVCLIRSYLAVVNCSLSRLNLLSLVPILISRLPKSVGTC